MMHHLDPAPTYVTGISPWWGTSLHAHLPLWTYLHVTQFLTPLSSGRGIFLDLSLPQSWLPSLYHRDSALDLGSGLKFGSLRTFCIHQQAIHHFGSQAPLPPLRALEASLRSVSARRVRSWNRDRDSQLSGQIHSQSRRDSVRAKSQVALQTWRPTEISSQLGMFTLSKFYTYNVMLHWTMS